MSYVIKEHWYRAGAKIKTYSTDHPERAEYYVVVKDYDTIAEARKLGYDVTKPLVDPQQVMEEINQHLMREGFIIPHVKH